MSELGKSFPTNVDKLKSEVGSSSGSGLSQTDVLYIYYATLCSNSTLYPDIQGQILKSESPGVFIIDDPDGDRTLFAPEPVKKMDFTGGLNEYVYCVLAPDFDGFYVNGELVTEYDAPNDTDAYTPDDLHPGSCVLYVINNNSVNCRVTQYDPFFIRKHYEDSVAD